MAFVPMPQEVVDKMVQDEEKRFKRKPGHIKIEDDLVIVSVQENKEEEPKEYSFPLREVLEFMRNLYTSS